MRSSRMRCRRMTTGGRCERPRRAAARDPEDGRVAAVDVVDQLLASGVARGDRVALLLAPEVGVAMVASSCTACVMVADDDPARVVQCVEDAFRPRWVMWSNETARSLVVAGVRVATAWDVAAVQRLLFGGWKMDPGRAWAQLHDLA